jgi:hypothetical protein
MKESHNVILLNGPRFSRIVDRSFKRVGLCLSFGLTLIRGSFGGFVHGEFLRFDFLFEFGSDLLSCFDIYGLKVLSFG